MSEINKNSRKISFKEFFETLQREYVVSNLRSKIYQKQKDRDYYVYREMRGKEESIKSIAARNNFPSIFTDRSLREKIEKEIYNEWGLPNFIYRSDSDRIIRRPKDILSYFHKGVDVSIKKPDGSISHGTVLWTNIPEQWCCVKEDNERIKVPFSLLARNFL